MPSTLMKKPAGGMLFAAVFLVFGCSGDQYDAIALQYAGNNAFRS